MEERPILFNDEMVRAILDGRKTQTRRIVKAPVLSKVVPPRHIKNVEDNIWEFEWRQTGDCNTVGSFQIKCPYGKSGDRLWVREAFSGPHRLAHSKNEYVYRATNHLLDIPFKGHWKPSIYMPRVASRINLEVTNVRVERIQDISIEDIMAEGITINPPYVGIDPTGEAIESETIDKDPWWYVQQLWDSINAKPKPVYLNKEIVSYVSYPWNEIRETKTYRGKPWEVFGNPRVWVVEFKVI